MAGRDELSCKGCGRVWRTYVETPCPKGGVDCWECDIQVVLDIPVGVHRDAQDDAHEDISYRCLHGTEYVLRCKGCCAKVSGWGVGAAGFRDMCDCEENGMAMQVEGIDYSPQGIEAARQLMIEKRDQAMTTWPDGIEDSIAYSHVVGLLAYLKELVVEAGKPLG